jgi:hypothetical protein
LWETLDFAVFPSCQFSPASMISTGLTRGL